MTEPAAKSGEGSSPAVFTLCEHCGLCCDGTLFTFVSLTDEEAARLRARDLSLGLREGKAVLQQRCSALSGTLCGIYEERPAACRAYECLLYKAVQEGEVDEREALRLIDEVKQSRSIDLLRRHFLGRHGNSLR
ncbi:MAG: YkgJ family cysteine cluster protein [Myxococcaceae bacterium]